MEPIDVGVAEANIHAIAKRLGKDQVTLCGCPIEELSREALIDGIRIAQDSIEQEHKRHATHAAMMKTFADARARRQ